MVLALRGFLQRGREAGVQMGEKKRKALLADDTRFFRTALRDLLQAEGWEVLEAKDGSSALEMARDQLTRLDLVILDIRMPELDGLEVLKQLRAEDLGKTIPVLMMTGAQLTPDQQQALGALKASFIDKSAGFSEVAARIRAMPWR